MTHYLKTKRRPTEIVYYAEAETGYGNVDIESWNEDALAAVLRAIDGYEVLVEERDALQDVLDRLYAEYSKEHLGSVEEASRLIEELMNLYAERKGEK